LDQFVIFLLGAFSVMLCVIFGRPDGTPLQKIPLLTLIAAALAVVVPILLFIPQLERWNTEDQPQVEANFVEWADGLPHWPPRAVPPTAEPGNKYIFAVFNSRKENAVEVKIKIMGIDLANSHHKLLISEEYPRMGRDDLAHLVTTTIENDHDYLAFCIEYKYRGAIIGDRQRHRLLFFSTSHYYKDNIELSRSAPRQIMDPGEIAKLSKDFSCGLEPRTTEQPQR
jgi:hypothetical protein